MARMRHGYIPEKLRNLAYIDELDKLGKRQRQVYEIIKEFGPISTEEIALKLNCYPHAITPRVYELREKGLVELWDIGTSPTSGKAVSLWKVTRLNPQLRLPL
jgi:Mn-dependent DtxR family transcriptional regulator